MTGAYLRDWKGFDFYFYTPVNKVRETVKSYKLCDGSCCRKVLGDGLPETAINSSNREINHE